MYQIALRSNYRLYANKSTNKNRIVRSYGITPFGRTRFGIMVDICIHHQPGSCKQITVHNSLLEIIGEFSVLRARCSSVVRAFAHGRRIDPS